MRKRTNHATMQRIFKSFIPLFTLLTLLAFGTSLTAQSMSENYRKMVVKRTIQAPADQVWEALVGDYGKIAHFSPFIYASSYEIRI